MLSTQSAFYDMYVLTILMNVLDFMGSKFAITSLSIFQKICSLITSAHRTESVFIVLITTKLINDH